MLEPVEVVMCDMQQSQVVRGHDALAVWASYCRLHVISHCAGVGAVLDEQVRNVLPARQQGDLQ